MSISGFVLTISGFSETNPVRQYGFLYLIPNRTDDFQFVSENFRFVLSSLDPSLTFLSLSLGLACVHG